MSKYIESLTHYARTQSAEVRVRGVRIGGDNPIVVQSMTNTDTMNTQACVEQIGRIRSAGCRMVRLTVQGRREAENLKNIAQECEKAGYGDVALVADVHFNPELAIIAAQYVDKVRINPGNYKNDQGQFAQLIKICKERGVALRIGVNHGSLSERMVEKWGDTPKGMVESAMEYLRECKKMDFDQVVVSIKSSNVRVMIYAYRLLAAEMKHRNMNFPLHLGVTEAGDGEQGRVKSAVGIGSLLADGLGDTIRVSLTESPENEIPVAIAIVNHFKGRENREECDDFIEPIDNPKRYKPYEYVKRESEAVGNIGGKNLPVFYGELNEEALEGVDLQRVAVLSAFTSNPSAEWRAAALNLVDKRFRRPILLHRHYTEDSMESLQIKAAADFGMLFVDGLADGVWIENSATSDQNNITQQGIDNLALMILQATRVRMSSTEYIACPGCGRTLFDLQATLAAIKAQTSHLKHLKIGIMGCIVNGPGEMADADYGYVGEGAGKVTLYKGQQVIRRALPEAKAIESLIEVIKSNGDWVEP